jgi:hypothetical protein
MPGFTTDYKMKYTILADGYQAKSEIKSVDDQITKLGGGLASSLGGAAGPIGIAAGALAGVAAAAVGATAAVFNLTKQAAEYGSVIYDASTKTGLHAETISTLSLAAKQADTDINQVTGGIAKFAKTVGAAADGSDKAAKQLKDFGITPQEAINDLDGTLNKVFKRIYDAKPGIEQITLAQKAFGKSGADLIPLIDQMGGELDKTKKKFEEMGLTISDKDAAAADQFGDQMTLLGAQIEMVGVRIGQKFMPVFLNMASELSGWLARNSGEVEHWAGVAGHFFEMVVKGAAVTIDALKNYYQGYKAFMEGIGLGFLVPKPFLLNAVEDSYNQSLLNQPKFAGGGSRAFSPSSLLDNEDLTGGKRTNAPKTNDAEFRKFFEDFGFNVTRTFGDALNKGSLHPLGKAIDLSVKGKTADQIAELIAAAIEKGYRLVDERSKIPGVRQTGPHLHFEQNYGTKGSIFQGSGSYGSIPLEYLQSLDAQRLGKVAGSQTALEAWLKKKRELTQKENDDELSDLERQFQAIIADERQAMDDRLAIRRSEADLASAILDDQLKSGILSETEYTKRVSELKIGMLEDERDELQQQVPDRQVLLRLQQIELEIQTQRIVGKRQELEVQEKLDKAYHEQLELMQSAADINSGKQKDPGQRVQREDMFAKLREHFSDSSNDFGVAAVDAATVAFQQLGEAVGQAVNAFVLYGSAGASVRQVTAQILASIAQQAAVQAIYELAQGLAVLALAFFGVPNAGPSAAAHFAAAAAYGVIGGVAAIAGRAVAGDSFKNKGGGGSSSKGGPGSSGAYSYGTGAQQDQTPYSRASQNAYVSGRDGDHARFVADAIDRLNDTITNRLQNTRPGDVLTAGMREKRGVIGRQVVDDIKSNAAIGVGIRKASGGR